MILKLEHSTDKPLQGTVALGGDKSLAHRAVLFGALARGESVICNYPDTGVTRSMRNALQTLGVLSTLQNGELRIEGNGFKPFPVKSSSEVAFCGNSATTIRLLTGALVGTRTMAVLDGSAGLRKRPMERIAEPLRKMGAKIETTDSCAPIKLLGGDLHGIDYTLPMASAQVLSALQLAALGANGKSSFRVPGPVRDHTVRMLREMGAIIETPDAFTSIITPLSNELKPLDATLPGDISSAAFLLAAAALVPQSVIRLTNVGINPTRTGILDILMRMGTVITLANKHTEMGEPVADIILEAKPLKGVEIFGDEVVRSIDEFPVIAALATCANGETVVRDAKELRYKETDRIHAICTQLTALGVAVEERDDGFIIQGGTLRGGTAQANGDHRIAMSMALLGLRADVSVEGAEILNESFPDFVSSLQRLGV